MSGVRSVASLTSRRTPRAHLGGSASGSSSLVVEELDGARRVGQLLLALLDPERSCPARDQVDATVLHALDDLGDLARAADRPQPVLGHPDDPELGLLLQAAPIIVL